MLFHKVHWTCPIEIILAKCALFKGNGMLLGWINPIWNWDVLQSYVGILSTVSWCGLLCWSTVNNATPAHVCTTGPSTNTTTHTRIQILQKSIPAFASFIIKLHFRVCGYDYWLLYSWVVCNKRMWYGL